MVLHIAHKMERGLDISQENLIAKNFIADMLSSVVDTEPAFVFVVSDPFAVPLVGVQGEGQAQGAVGGRVNG